MQQDEISQVSIILRILILSQVSSFYFGVSMLESPLAAASQSSVR
jgi:hypothetical protein